MVLPSSDLHEMIKIKEKKPVVHLRVETWGLETNLITTKIGEGVEHTMLETKAKETEKSEAKAKDSSSKDRPSGGQGQECSKPRPSPRILRGSGYLLQNFVNFPENSNILQEKKVFKIFFASSLAFFTTKQNWS